MEMIYKNKMQLIWKRGINIVDGESKLQVDQKKQLLLRICYVPAHHPSGPTVLARLKKNVRPKWYPFRPNKCILSCPNYMFLMNRPNKIDKWSLNRYNYFRITKYARKSAGGGATQWKVIAIRFRHFVQISIHRCRYSRSFFHVRSLKIKTIES